LYGSATADASIVARWLIWDFGRTALNVEAAQRNARSLETGVQSQERIAIEAAATAYYAVLADQEVIEAAQETVRQRDRELEIARGRVETGSDPDINRTRAEIAAQTARLDLSTARATAANDTAALAATLGLDPAHAPHVVRPPDVQFDDNPEHAADSAIRLRPEVLAAQMRVASAESSLAAAHAGWRPSLTANASVGASYTQYFNGSSAIRESGTASLVFSVPIYDPTIPASIRIAEGNLYAARAELTAQVLNVRTDAVQAALAVHAAREQLAEAEHNAALAAANLHLAEGRYAAGAAALLELVDAQAQDATARLAVIQRRFQLESAKVRLLTAVNRANDLAGR
jgi:outer membrane protein